MKTSKLLLTIFTTLFMFCALLPLTACENGLPENGSDNSDYNSEDSYDTDDTDNIDDYNLSLGVYIMIDVSGSMSDTIGEKSFLEWAKIAAKAYLNILTEKDYIAVVPIGSNSSNSLPLTSVTKKDDIIQAIDNLNETTENITIANSLMIAAESLKASETDIKHIILISDGQIASNEIQNCVTTASNYYERNGVTVSAVIIGNGTQSNLIDIVTATRENGWDLNQTGGGYYRFDSNGIANLGEEVINDLAVIKSMSTKNAEFSFAKTNKFVKTSQDVKNKINFLKSSLGGYSRINYSQA